MSARPRCARTGRRADTEAAFSLAFSTACRSCVDFRQVVSDPAGKSEPNPDSNEDLNATLRGVASGDRDAMHRLFEATSGRLYAIILRFLRDRERAEDVLQEVYLIVWQRAGRFDPQAGAAMAWLGTIARNSALTELRADKRDRKHRHDAMREADADRPQITPDRLGATHDGRLLAQCLDRLGENQRSSILLAFFDGLTHSELAERLGKPVGTVKSWIRRGLANLKGCLDG